MGTVKPITFAGDARRFMTKLTELLSYQTYAGDPTGNATPRWIGDRCLDTSNDDWYVSYGTANTEWKVTT